MLESCPWPLAALLDVNALRNLGVVPHYFGLGFIQVKLNEHWRLHAWVPDWPTIPGAEHEFHDHRYPFQSHVLMGALNHEIVALGAIREWPAAGDQELLHVSCQPGQAAATARIGYTTPIPIARFQAIAGSSYELDSDAFHVAQPVGDTITLVRRETPRRPMARVLRPLGAAAMCPFSLNPGEDACWERLGQMLAVRP